MARMKGKGLTPQSIFGVILIAVIALFLFGKFSVETTEGREFTVPTDVDDTIFTVFKMIAVFALVFGAWALFSKLSGGAMTSKDAFTIILIGIGIILLWDKLAPVLNSSSLDSISFSVGQKLGVFTP